MQDVYLKQKERTLSTFTFNDFLNNKGGNMPDRKSSGKSNQYVTWKNLIAVLTPIVICGITAFITVFLHFDSKIERQTEIIRKEFSSALKENRIYLDKRLESFETNLRNSMNEKFEMIDAKFSSMNEKFEMIDAKFSSMNEKFEMIDAKFSSMDKRFERIEADIRILGLLKSNDLGYVSIESGGRLKEKGNTLLVSEVKLKSAIDDIYQKDKNTVPEEALRMIMDTFTIENLEKISVSHNVTLDVLCAVIIAYSNQVLKDISAVTH